MSGENPSGTDRTSSREPGRRSAVHTESRWPMAAAVLASAVLTLLLPDDLRLGPRWAVPLAEGLLLVVLISGDPGRISRRSTALRAVAVVMVVVLVGSAIWSTVQLIDDLIHGGHETSPPMPSCWPAAASGPPPFWHSPSCTSNSTAAGRPHGRTTCPPLRRSLFPSTSAPN